MYTPWTVNTAPSHNDHDCTPSGIEGIGIDFRRTLESKVRDDPLQPFPSLYEHIRSKFSNKLKFDERHLFLSEVPTFESIQSTLYQIRREYLPTAPYSQEDFDTDLDWFLIEATDNLDVTLEDDRSDNQSKENIVKGDKICSDGLRVIMFASEHSLKILTRARTILGDPLKSCSSGASGKIFPQGDFPG